MISEPPKVWRDPIVILGLITVATTGALFGWLLWWAFQ
jgi:hypothetical protein